MGYFLQLAASVLLYASFRTVHATIFDAPVVEHCLEHINGLMGKPSCGTLAGTIHASMG